MQASIIMESMKHPFSISFLRATLFMASILLMILGFHGSLSLAEADTDSPLLLPLLAALAILVFLFMTRNSRINPAWADKMSGEQFERFCRSYFRRHGYYRIRTTQKTRDYGADLVMYRGIHKAVVQAKRYERNIGVSAVQEALASKAYYHASEAIVITNQYFTASAVRLAEVNKVKLIDRDALFHLKK